MTIDRIRVHFPAPAGAVAFFLLLAWSLSCAASAQQSEMSGAGNAAAAQQAQAPADMQSGGMTEDELRQMLAGKTFYLRGGYLDDSLSFNEHGGILGHPPQGSYTLSVVDIDKVRMTRHKVELEGVRYGLHFLGALPYEDSSSAFDRVRITPKKKVLRITIDRELVVKPKKEKKEKGAGSGIPANSAANQSLPSPADASPAAAEELKAEIAATPAAERPSDPDSVTTTTSPAHSAQVLKDALANIFAARLDERMMAAMPDFWKLYYQAAAAKSDYRPSDPAVMLQSTVDRKAKLITSFQPESNDFAQQAGVAGMALYHVVVGADGTPREIAVARPIGFGLDENAVAAIRKAKFAPAIKDGKPVPVLLDLVVEFRIYSKRTAAQSSTGQESEKPAAPSLPGPYSAPHPQ